MTRVTGKPRFFPNGSRGFGYGVRNLANWPTRSGDGDSGDAGNSLGSGLGARWAGNSLGGVPNDIADIRATSIDVCTTSTMFFARLTAVYRGEPPYPCETGTVCMGTVAVSVVRTRGVPVSFLMDDRERGHGVKGGWARADAVDGDGGVGK